MSVRVFRWIRDRRRSGVMAGFIAGLVASVAVTVAGGSGWLSPAAANPGARAVPAVPAAVVRPADSVGVEHVEPNLEDGFAPIAPCRIVDTRSGTGTNSKPMTNGETRTFYVGGTANFLAQGGKSGGCGIPVGATAIAASLTATSPSSRGYVRAWANGQTEPSATVLQYAASTSNTAGATISINSTSAAGLKVRNYNGPTDLLIDITGYYIPKIHGLFYTGSTAYTYSGTPRILSVAYVSTGLADVTVDRDVTYCTLSASPYYNGYFASAQPVGGSVVRLRTSQLDPTTHTAVQTDTFAWLNIVC